MFIHQLSRDQFLYINPYYIPVMFSSLLDCCRGFIYMSSDIIWLALDDQGAAIAYPHN